ncbi:MAG TPA: putative sulfate/molybdate transporter [Candidatus Acidoferrales bacterium]|nr:putative sulfate/molybdate transporter [Candidatus Acidoferrales bacterium]
MNWLRERIRFDRNELSGAFGDIGTDFPLLVGMILAAGLDAPSVLIVFGAMQVMTGLVYGMPMPVQPLKAMAVIVITQRIAPDVLYGGGLAIGVVMLLLTLTGAIAWVARVVPKSVVRGVQFGLGMQLASLALKDYVTSESWPGYALAAAAFVITLALLGNRRVPPAPIIIALGIVYALAFKLNGVSLAGAAGFSLPKLHVVTWADVLTGFFLLTLPQLPLSLGNSILATQRVAADLFPEKKVTVRKISLTYSLMNLVSPFFSGVPTCHGSGGIAGHYTFGGRTGGSVLIYGAMYLALGIFFGRGFQTAVKLFPLPVLGVILLFEALALMRLVRDMLASAADFFIVLFVGLIAFGLPYGYVIGVVIGTMIARSMPKKLAE